ncbi:hypothetical protein C3F09_01250 [candidate division GN15 bacterium]|uniref:histidine kinase n=1 Tax=candidate division GN15 bacterium TaxID=2072418 RepID=A0A855XBE8_9BACT|nr:MAG: hypothetical protein C3F09_01250 [candidate division GN15 bacterium]
MAFLILGVFGSAVAPVAKELELPASPDQLPHEVECTRYEPQPGSYQEMADLNGDGDMERILWYSRFGDNCNFASAVLVYSSLFYAQPLLQYNGPRMTSKIWSGYCLDVWGDAGKEVILTKTTFDSVWLEILCFGPTLDITDTITILAAVGQGLSSPGGWHSLHCAPLAGIDINGDGSRDLIYCRTAKPDSAFERAIIGYDLKNRAQIWSYSLGDQTNLNVFNMVSTSFGDTVFAFTVLSTGNRYVSSNGYNSQRAYALTIDRYGKPLWSHEVGGTFFYPACRVIDLDGDGQVEVLATNQSADTIRPKVTLQAYDLTTGLAKFSTEEIPASGGDVFVYGGTDGHPPSVFFTAYDTLIHSIHSFDGQLRRTASCDGVSALGVADLDRDGSPEVFAGLERSRLIVLNSKLDLIAFSVILDRDLPALVQRQPFSFQTFDNAIYGITLLERPMALVLWAKYKWLVVGVLGSSLILLALFRVQVRRLVLSAAGVPGLDRIDSLVLIVGRSGDLVYVNHHRLADRLLGRNHSAGRPLSETDISRHRSLCDLIARPLDKDFTPLSEQVEIGADGGSIRLAVAVYPRLDRSRKFDGKIVIVEDISHKIDWQRKVVLGEAAQRWMHKLKGSVATARIQLDNIREDSRLVDLAQNPLLRSYLETIEQNLQQTSQTAAKVLRFSSIGQPNRAPVDLNALVGEAIRSNTGALGESIIVVKKLQPDLPRVSLDGAQISEVLDNLLSNAIRAVKSGGTLTVTTQLATELHCSAEEEGVVLSVADTGAGISPSDLDRIFAPGFSRSGSTGIGLALVKEIVENHGGIVEVTSEPGVGSTFVVRLPLERDQHGA